MQNFWRGYGFTQDPFSDSTSRNVFIPKIWHEYLDLFPQFTRFCNTLLVVSGPQGVGKTTLMHTFLEQQGMGNKAVYISAHDCLGIEYLLQLLAEHFAAPYDSYSSLPVTEQLDKQLNYLKQQKGRRLLIIDDAEHLPLDMRQACLQTIQQQNVLETCLPIILVGSQELHQQLMALLTPTSAKEYLHFVELLPLDKAQTRDYLQHCCSQASNRPVEFPFSEEEIANIYKSSQGYMGKINTAATATLSAKQEPTFNWRKLLNSRLVWWSGAIVAILIVLVIYRVINQAETTASLVQTPPFLSQTPKAVESNYQVGDTLVKTGGGATDASATSKPVVVAQKPIPSLATLPSNTNDPELKPKDANINKDTQVLNTTTHSPAPQVEAHELPKVVKPWAKVTPSNKVTVKLTSPHNSNEYFANFMTKKIALQKQHIVHISPHAYTIQLLASNDLHTIAKFIADHQLQATASVVETKINNKPRYLIIYGVFQDYGTAKRGLQELSPVLKAGNPWVRSYQSVQAVMKKTATLTH